MTKSGVPNEMNQPAAGISETISFSLLRMKYKAAPNSLEERRTRMDTYLLSFHACIKHAQFAVR